MRHHVRQVFQLSLAGGGFVATWVGPGNNGSVEIRAQRFNTDGTPAGTEFVVNSSLAGDQGSPKVAGLLGGGFVVTWGGPGAAGPEIYAQQYSATGAAVGREFVVNTTTAGDQLRPTVSALPDGGYLVAWAGNEVAGANNYDIFAQRYWADGSANGGQFQVNAAFKAVGIGPVKLLYNETAVVIALVHVMLPFMVIPVWTSLQKLDPWVENAALSLSASHFTTLRRVVLPQVLPGVLSGGLIVFALSASAFAIPGLLGGRRLKMVATLISDEYLHELNWPMGAAIAVVLLVLNLAVMLGMQTLVESAWRKRMGS